jgi:type I restriction enzyme S subunit
VRIWDRGPAYLNQHLFRVLPEDGIDKAWLRFALDAATRRFAGLMHGSAMTHITQPMMKQVRVPVPSEGRQQGIARNLDESWRKIDRVVGALARQLELLNEHQQALIIAAVTGQLNVTRAAA